MLDRLGDVETPPPRPHAAQQAAELQGHQEVDRPGVPGSGEARGYAEPPARPSSCCRAPTCSTRTTSAAPSSSPSGTMTMGGGATCCKALERGDLHTRVSEKELDARLTELFRLTRTSFEEGGSNILFLALGFLQWTQKAGAPPCRAPILLIPVSLQRSSVRAGFRLALHEDEARFNPTLLELLRQDFELRMPELEGELPTDAIGARCRQHLADRAHPYPRPSRLGGDRERHPLDLLVHQVPDVEGPARPHRASEAQPGRPPPDRHPDRILRRRLGFSGRRAAGPRLQAGRHLRTALGRLLPAGGGSRRSGRQGFRAVRPAWHRQEPDDRQHHRPMPRPPARRCSSSRRRRPHSRSCSGVCATSVLATTASRCTRPRRRNQPSSVS